MRRKSGCAWRYCQGEIFLKTLVLFNYDWDRLGFERNAIADPRDMAGFDLFSFPSNAQLAWFDIERFVERLARLAVESYLQQILTHGFFHAGGWVASADPGPRPRTLIPWASDPCCRPDSSAALGSAVGSATAAPPRADRPTACLPTRADPHPGEPAGGGTAGRYCSVYCREVVQCVLHGGTAVGTAVR